MEPAYLIFNDVFGALCLETAAREFGRFRKSVYQRKSGLRFLQSNGVPQSQPFSPRQPNKPVFPAMIRKFFRLIPQPQRRLKPMRNPPPFLYAHAWLPQTRESEGDSDTTAQFRRRERWRMPLSLVQESAVRRQRGSPNWRQRETHASLRRFRGIRTNGTHTTKAQGRSAPAKIDAGRHFHWRYGPAPPPGCTGSGSSPPARQERSSIAAKPPLALYRRWQASR